MRQTVNQHLHRGLVEFGLDAIARRTQRGTFDLDHDRGIGRNNSGGAARFALGEVKHFTKTAAALDRVDLVAAKRYIDIAADQDKQRITDAAFLEHHLARFVLAPFRDADHFPEFGVVEGIKKRQCAQRIELLGVGSVFTLGAQLRECRREVTAKIHPVLVTMRAVLGHRNEHDVIKHCRQVGAQLGWWRRVGIDDGVGQAHRVAGVVGQLAGQEPVHHHAQ